MRFLRRLLSALGYIAYHEVAEPAAPAALPTPRTYMVGETRSAVTPRINGADGVTAVEQPAIGLSATHQCRCSLAERWWNPTAQIVHVDGCTAGDPPPLAKLTGTQFVPTMSGADSGWFRVG